jgi:UDP-N-acetylmuramoyl-L-alanyl-D-glutamate--2,6-diaminopimelate ligase
MSFRGTVKKFIPTNLFKKVEPYGHLLEAVVFNIIYGFPARKMKVIGVTGTNGKTSTAFLIHSMMVSSGKKTGLMTTVGYGVGKDVRPQMVHMTTQTVPVLMKRLKEMKKQDVEWLILETTSHALAQNRVWGVPYSVAVMTNITHEHLAYHGTFERYRDAKRKMFQMANKNKKGLQIGIINAEDPSAALFTTDIKNHITYGMKDGDMMAKHVKLTPTGSRFAAVINGEEYWVSCNLPGTFNVFNAMAAVGVGVAVGLDKKQIESGIEALKSVEGRMTKVEAGQPFDIIVDYAHTPDSFEKLFKDMKTVVKGKTIVMFGSLGGGDKGKRPQQGELAGKYADLVVITEEDDRNEDPDQIMNDIAAGAEKSGKKRDKDLFLIHNRSEAIKFAFSKAKKGDTVLLLGKGHEKTIESANGKERAWNEVSEAKKALKKS